MPESTEAPTLTLGNCTATLERPRPFAQMALARDRATLDTDPSVAIGVTCAALAMCWPRNRRWPGSRPRAWKLGSSLIEYGADVFDALMAEGLPVGPILTAAAEAYGYAVSGLGEEEVKAAEDFSEPPVGGGSDG